MTECEAAIELGGHDVVIFPEGLADGELFSKRNAICMKPRVAPHSKELPSVTREMVMESENVDEKVEEMGGGPKEKQRERERLVEVEKQREEARDQALDIATPWFIFVKSVVEMEDWHHALVHASDHPANAPTLAPLEPVFWPADMNRLVETLDEQPDIIPMRWLNALIGRLFFSYYRTQTLESYIIGRLMKKISKVKRPGFLSDVVVREVSVGNKAPTFSKPMLKELTKEGDASLELQLHYKGEVRITVEATATINLGARFKTYTVKLVLALVIREIEGNLLVKVKRPPSSRIWYAFTQMPRIVMDVEPVVSDRQITWGMILSTIESRVKEVIQESVVMPNMDDISFFESSRYQHRGGIWADASRRETSPPYSPEDTSQDDSRSTASAPASELLRPTDPEHPPIQRSHSAEEAALENKISSEPQILLTDPRRTSPSVPSTPDTGSKRRSWFGAPRDDEPSTPNSLHPHQDENDESEQRGRSPETDSTLTRRSSSTPINACSTSQDTTPHADGGQKEGGDYLSPQTTRRSSSQHSQASSSRETSAPLSSDDESSGTGAESSSASSSWRPKSPQASGSGRGTATSSTAAFLQNLKSRAGDKQALSNTAKEAMRKWGVNWSGLRRDSNNNHGEELPDASQGEQRHLDPRIHRSRPSYAEVRAAVEQRKGREPETTLGAELRSEPINILQSDKGKERARSASPSTASGSTAAPYFASSSPVHDALPSPLLGVEGKPHSRSASPANLIQRTESARSKSSAEGIPSIAADDMEAPPLPIHTQPPQARTMTIPGIHASHRGEVMSMGYAPPLPPASAEQKKPAIQSVYRLWKNPSTSGSQPRVAGALPETQVGFAGRDEDAAGDAQSEMLAPRPVPPPLPPRSNSAVALQGRQDAAGGGASSASAVLQSIVSKDRTRRESLEPAGEEGANSTSSASTSVPAGAPPPLPARSAAATVKPPALPPRRPSGLTAAPAPATV
ncbi:predicted protein [Postia placenta Mad-698-R]|nr:predicted protein [Postia placenta Mad-698-R]